MSVIDSQRHASTGRRIRRMFSTSRSGKDAKTSLSRERSKTIPGMGHELSLIDGTQTNGRTLRIFCDIGKKEFKTLSLEVNDLSTVGWCVNELSSAISGKVENRTNFFALYEVIGRQLPPLTVIDNTDTYVNPDYREIYSSRLSESRKVMDVFAVMVPAPGLFRRLELRNNSSITSTPSTPNQSKAETFNSLGPTSSLSSRNPKSIPSFDSRSSRNSCRLSFAAPRTSYLLLLKGSRPEYDLLVHNFAPLENGSRAKVTIGTSEDDDIPLYLAPNKTPSRRLSSRETKPSPANFSKGDVQDKTKTEMFYIEVVSSWNAVKPESKISVYTNGDKLTCTHDMPIKRNLLPGDIIRFESEGLSYVFLFKDSTCVPEHELYLPFLNSLHSTTPKILGPSNGSRSASRTARIAAACEAKIEVSAERVVSSPFVNKRHALDDELCPSSEGTEYIISLLFPRILASVSADKNYLIDLQILTNGGSNFPDVSIASACYAHFVRSIAAMVINRKNGQDDMKVNRLETFLETLGKTLSNQLDILNSYIDKHFAPAMWKVAFCFYTANYLSSGWLQESSCLKSDVNGGNLQRATPDSDSFDAAHTSFGRSINNVEDLLYIESLREMVLEEADQALDAAIMHALVKITSDAAELCRTFANTSSNRSATKARQLQQSFFGKLDLIRDCITNVLMEFTNENFKLSQAVAYTTPADDDPFSPTGSADKSPTSVQSDSDSLESSTTGSDAVYSLEDKAELSVSARGRRKSHTPGRKGIDSALKQTPRSRAQTRVEEVFFRRLLNGLANSITELFITYSVNIDWHIGVQLLNFMKAIEMWMKGSGVGNYKEPISLIFDIASLMSTSREVLFKTHWTQLVKVFPNIPQIMLWFLLKNYENGEGMRYAASMWHDLELEIRDLGYSPEEAISDYDKKWKQSERLDFKSKRSENGSGHFAWRPIDLASLFHMSKTRQKITEFDETLAAKNFTFRWAILLRRFPPPGLRSNDSETPRFRAANTELQASSRSNPPFLSSSKVQKRNNAANSVRDFGDLLDEVGRSGTREQTSFPSLKPPQPTQSLERPAISVLAFKSRAGTRLQSYSRSEFNGPTTSRLAKQAFLPKNRYNLYQDRPLLNNLGNSSPNLFTDIGQCRSNKREDTTYNRFPNRFGSTANLARSMEFGNRHEVADIRSLREDWSQFKKTSGASSQVSTIEPSQPRILLEDCLNGNVNKRRSGSCSFNPFYSKLEYEDPLRHDLHQVGIQNGINFITRPNSIRSLINVNSYEHYGNGLTTGEWNMRYDQSPIGVNRGRPPDNLIRNVTLERNDKGSFGLAIVEGHTTKAEKPGLYIKSTNEEVSSLLLPGDRILAINGKDVTGMTFKESSELLKQCKSRVTLTIQRGSIDNPEDLNESRE